jgi:hypothetical protein
MNGNGGITASGGVGPPDADRPIRACRHVRAMAHFEGRAVLLPAGSGGQLRGPA